MILLAAVFALIWLALIMVLVRIRREQGTFERR